MSATVDALKGQAFHHGPALRANEVIAQARERHTPGREATSWEFVLPVQFEEAYLTTKVLPRLVYFLDCRGAKLPKVGAHFVSMFEKDTVYCVDGAIVIEALAALAGLSCEELVRRYGQDGAGDPKLLGGAP